MSEIYPETPVTPGAPTLGEVYWRGAMTDPDDIAAWPTLAPEHQADIERGALAVADAAIRRRIEELDAQPGPQPAKVIVVTEVPIGDRAPVERHYAAATQWDDSEPGRLRLFRADHHLIASYGTGTWLSVREDGATVPDATARALGIARRALSEIRTEAEKRGDAEFFGVAADDALGEISAETEL